MRYQPLPANFHAANRTALARTLEPGAFAVIDTAPVVPRAGDVDYPYRPDSNFYYLTGIDQPGAVLVLLPGHPNPDRREILFVPESSARSAQWDGGALTPAAATKRSGIAAVYPLSELEGMLRYFMQTYFVIYSNSPARAGNFSDTAPLHQLRSVVPALTTQRLIKHPAEIAQIRRAVDITAQAIQKARAVLKPGLPEYALEAELAAEFIRGGAQAAFPSIVASGAHATTIHYMDNDGAIGSRDLVLLDVGAEVGWYAADISRTVPAAGRFTLRQRAVYDAVYRTQQAAVKLHKPGASVWDIDQAMRQMLTAEIAQLKLPGDLQTYYPHISHHLGLDVHDVGDARVKFEPGMVVTCEPGLYLEKEGIGVRLEDDILITKTGCEVLSKGIPSHPEEL